MTIMIKEAVKKNRKDVHGESKLKKKINFKGWKKRYYIQMVNKRNKTAKVEMKK